MRSSSIIAIVAILIGASLVFSGRTSAHNIDLKKAREAARDYARSVRDASNGKYAHYSTNCVAAFPGHNHIARCLIDYKNEADAKKGVYTCRELIEIKMAPHNQGLDYTLWGEHASSNQCGSRRLTYGTRLG
jgi:hypothetical protein